MVILKIRILLITFSMKLIGNQNRRLEKGKKKEEQTFNACYHPTI